MSATTQGSVFVDLVDVATGEMVTRTAVDARELLASGSYVLTDAAPVAAPSAGGGGDGGGVPSSAAESSTDAAETSESEAKPTRRKAQG